MCSKNNSTAHDCVGQPAARWRVVHGGRRPLPLPPRARSYPSIPFARGPPINGPWTAPPQYPSVSLLSWGGAFGNAGDGTARYWVRAGEGESAASRPLAAPPSKPIPTPRSGPPGALR